MSSVLSADLWRRISSLLDAALDLPPERWERFVAEASNGDVDLQRRVGELLDAASRAGSFLEEPAMRLLGEPPRTPAHDPSPEMPRPAPRRRASL